MAQIVVVEDDDCLTRVLAYQLRKAGHTPIVARNGEMALREAQEHPDLILLDLGLPDISGCEVLQRLTREPATAQIPVVVISGEPDVAALVADSGTRAVAAILRKPVSGRELCDVVDAALGTPAELAEECETRGATQRAQLVYRLITEGSNTLVRMVCLRLEADRACRCGSLAAPAPSWTDLARAGRQEGLLSGGEGALLAARPSVLVETH
jgi:DNA-binding response OmpR family regulator